MKIEDMKIGETYEYKQNKYSTNEPLLFKCVGIFKGTCWMGRLADDVISSPTTFTADPFIPYVKPVQIGKRHKSRNHAWTATLIPVCFDRDRVVFFNEKQGLHSSMPENMFRKNWEVCDESP